MTKTKDCDIIPTIEKGDFQSMFSKSIKNKALCFLLTVAAVCPAEEVKSSSDTIVHEKTSTIETIDINGMPFCLSSSEETLAIKQEVPASTKETQEIKVEGLPFLIEKVDGEVEKSNVDSSKAELNDLLNLSPVQFVEKPVQSAKTEPLSQEKKQKYNKIEIESQIQRTD